MSESEPFLPNKAVELNVVPVYEPLINKEEIARQEEWKNHQTNLINRTIEIIKSHIANPYVLQNAILDAMNDRDHNFKYLDTGSLCLLFSEIRRPLLQIDNQRLYNEIIVGGYLTQLERKLGHPFKIHMGLVDRKPYFNQTAKYIVIYITWEEEKPKEPVKGSDCVLI